MVDKTDFMGIPRRFPKRQPSPAGPDGLGQGAIGIEQHQCLKLEGKERGDLREDEMVLKRVSHGRYDERFAGSAAEEPLDVGVGRLLSPHWFDREDEWTQVAPIPPSDG